MELNRKNQIPDKKLYKLLNCISYQTGLSEKVILSNFRQSFKDNPYLFDSYDNKLLEINSVPKKNLYLPLKKIKFPMKLYWL